MSKITYYPLVLIPPLIQDFLDQEKVPDILQKKIEAPKPTSIPNQSLPRLSLPLTAIIGIAAVSFAFGLGLLNFLQFILGLFIGLGWLLISINHYRKSISRFEQQQIAQKLRQQQYDRSVKEWEALHEGLAEFQEKWRLSRTASLKQLLIGKVMLPVATSTAQVGVSERFFLQYLTEYFVTETKQGESLQVIPGEELPIPGFDYNYSTDFSLVDPHTGLKIDIEIDEPYEGKTKKPHHCCDQGKDTRRNQFFLDGNWVIIRFSEEQIVRYPESCCQVIAEVIAKLIGNFCFQERLIKIQSLQRQPQWTIAEAKKMARWNRRASYLAETGVYVQHYSRSNSNTSRTRTKSRRKSTQRNRKRRRNF